MHRRNFADNGIGAFKDHLNAIIAGVDKTFPMHPWHLLLPQIEMTLNMLHPINIIPKISAYAYMHDQHDFNKMQLALM